MSKEQEKKDLYKIYNQIKESCLSFEKKKVILRSLLIEGDWSWKVVAISHAAVVAHKKNGFKKPTKKLERHHPIAFAKTADEMLSDKKNLTFSEWFKLIAENEKVHLITKEEHKSSNYEKYDIPSDLGLFKNQYIGWKYGKEEKDFLRKLAEDKNISTESSGNCRIRCFSF